jgi:3-oxoacyl-[acyl-carrier protein] reductase
LPVSYDFSGKIAVVTGGSNGIGRAIGERLHEAGAQVWSWDVERAHSDRMQHVTVDVTQADQISAALTSVLNEVSRIDILVNNAGLIGGTRSVEELAPAPWRRIIEVNLTGVFEVSRQVVPVMRRTGWGRIVNIASLAGKEGTPNLSAYSAAKAGVIAFTKFLGKELADTEIRVNSVAPAASKPTF